MDDGSKLMLHHYPGPSAEAKRGTVLYVHGATFPAELSVGFKFDNWSWADDLQSAGFDVWALDFAGFGGSDPYTEPPEDAIPGRCGAAVRRIEAVLHEILACSSEAKVSIVAHSWGTIPAGAFAASHPDPVARLVLFGPIAKRQGTVDTTAMPASYRVSIEDQYQRFTEDVPEGEPPVLSNAHFADWAVAYLATDKSSGDVNPPAVLVPSGPAADIRDAWSGHFPYDPAQIVCPALIVRGEWDSLTQDADAAWLSGNLSRVANVQDIKIARATHLAHLEAGRFDLYKACRDFLLGDR